ncbi:NAD-dependent epimerase/dehydratase family protein [Aeromicrobium duanguangcaii]|uniref:NAD-dependent epimerase/dehydratase family protein n=1 Tax=Aeromicrobium duanguangcaii TaxID=2968086 RepID=A0ABY5KAU5_9ACTN|nr:NAD-dependent epimerase/dehydratase family protein [Aeromicrobium duanguangcaii]MCL3837363.1 NAD-dependent epimerase/dehydratase family protein [Aeromicrobium duanguangcaii]UUI67394.1 NAD-dependent epimerase/dehydratase family protein [Aeromicrobium duanguangcaii]
MRALVAGGAGFVGSHLVERLVAMGHDVVVVDDFSTGRRENLAAVAHEVTILEANITDAATIDAIEGPLDQVFNLASPASPVDYHRLPIHTLMTGSLGVKNTLDLAHAHGARYLLASTSEVYGDPQVHPQPETYLGHVNPVGPRSVYDEAKRFGEAMTAAYRREFGVDTKIVRIFNTFGPRMRVEDGRAIPNFVHQALMGREITVAGDGAQTRSICYVDDLVSGLVAMMESSASGPVNLGNPEEISMLDLATWIRDLAESDSKIVHVPRPVDDPQIRRPDITLAGELFGWSPSTTAEIGLKATIEDFRNRR